MTGVSATSLGHTSPHIPSPLQTGYEAFFSGKECIRGGRGMSEDMWNAGENPNISINVCRHTNSFKSLQRRRNEREQRNTTGNNPNAPQRRWWDNPALTLSQPPQQMSMTKTSTRVSSLWRTVPMRTTGTTQHPPWRWIIGHGWMLSTKTPILTSTQPAHASSQPPNIRSTFSYNAEKFLNVGAIWGIASGYGCMVLVVRWCGFHGICTVQYSPENSGYDVLLRVRHMWVSGTNSDGECTLIFICRRDEAKLSGIRRWGLLSYSTTQGGSLNDYHKLSTKSSEIG